MKCNNSSNELSTPATDNVYVKSIYVKNSFTYGENESGPEVRYLTDVMSPRFRSLLVSRYAENIYNERKTRIFFLHRAGIQPKI